MIKNIIDSIADALFQMFGSGYEIYTESVEQGLQEPCFLIRCLDPVMNMDLNRRYKKNMTFVIQYFPYKEEKIDECADVMEKLFDCLSDLTVNEKVIHGSDLNGQINDGVLTFTVNYNLFVLRSADPAVDMEDLTLNTEAKG